MLQTIENVNAVVNNFVWGVPAMVCIIGVGLVLQLVQDLYSSENLGMPLRILSDVSSQSQKRRKVVSLHSRQYVRRLRQR